MAKTKTKVVDMVGKVVLVSVDGDFEEVQKEFKTQGDAFLKAGAVTVLVHNKAIDIKVLSEKELFKVGLQRIKK